MDDIALIDDIALLYINCTFRQARASLISRPLTPRGSAGGARFPLRRTEPPWQPTPNPLARIAEARSCDRRSSARPPKRHQPADRLIAASGVNQLRLISRDENGRPGHPRPALRGEHLVRDTEAPELRGRQGAAATHRAASVAYAVTATAPPDSCQSAGFQRARCVAWLGS
jgi:hypothetical protein